MAMQNNNCIERRIMLRTSNKLLDKKYVERTFSLY